MKTIPNNLRPQPVQLRCLSARVFMLYEAIHTHCSTYSSRLPECLPAAFCSTQPNCSVIAWNPAWLCGADMFPHLSDLLSKQSPVGS